MSLIFDIENQGDNNIKGIEGILYVYDMFGNNFMSLTFNMTGFTLLANSSLKLDDWGREINPFIDSDVKLRDSDFVDLSFDFVVSSVVYTDGTKETF